MEVTRIALDPDGLAAFIRKLEAWATTLPPNEQAFLHQMVADAADAANEDVSGYANVSRLLHEDDVSGYGLGLHGTGALAGSIAGYADGLSRDQADYADHAFVVGQSQT